MTPIDWVALAILLGSIALGLIRGFAREAFSLAAWIAAFFAARALSPLLAHYLPDASQPELRVMAAAIIIFVLVLIFAHLVSTLLGKVVKLAGLGGLNHLLGMVFGAGRGVVLLVLLTLAAGFTALPRSKAWRDSLVGVPMESAAQKVIPWLPHDLAVLVRYS